MDPNHSIDLPSAPSTISGEPESLRGVKIEIHLSDNSVLHGTLESLSLDKNLCSFLPNDNNQVEMIFMENICYVRFTQSLEFNPKAFPNQESSQPQNKSDHPFNIEFSDNKKLSGTYASSLEMEQYICLFMHIEKDYLQRIFIPKTNTKNYSLGKKLGEVLQEKDEVDAEELQTSLEKQEELRSKPLGEYLKESGIVSEEQLKIALAKQKTNTKMRIGDILISEGLISEDQLSHALMLQKDDRSKKLGDLLVEMGAAKEEAIYEAVASKLGIPFIRLQNYAINKDAVLEVPAKLAKEHGMMPIAYNDSHLVVAVSNPSATDATNVLGFVTNRVIEIVISPTTDIDLAIEEYYDKNQQSDLAIQNAEMELDAGNEDSNDASDIKLEQMANERPIVRLVNQVFADANNRNASDIHLRPRKKSIELLYRINGNMVHIRNFGKSLHAAITSRIKILGLMDITQRRLPQDGRIQISLGGGNIDMRVSVMPTVHGESTVIRLLASSANLKPIEEVGFNQDDVGKIKELLNRGGGIILVTGPTGSGKTTTLYSALNELRKHNHNIITIEDPVEIQLDGVEQVQVHKEIGFTFAKGLRNILRHDPDVIMLGEIRDEETAKIAVQCAQTGHLVLSTLHTNTAAGTIARLNQMGIPNYLIASTVLGVISQRLIKKNCDECLEPETIEHATRRVLGIDENVDFVKGSGCKICLETGFTGRIPVYELMILNEEVKEVILNSGSETEIHKTAVEHGLETIVENALRHASAKATPVSEVHKIFTS